MRQQRSKRVQECDQRAAQARARAETTTDPALHAEFLEMERRWAALGGRFAAAEGLAGLASENSDQRRDFGERTHTSAEPDDVLRLQEISSLLVQEGDLDGLYGRMLDAAISLMSADMGSMQRFEPERRALQLVAWRGFHPQSAAFWERIAVDTGAVCGLASSAGCRVVMPDVEAEAVGAAHLEEYRRSNIRAVQSTPLMSRSGGLLGMISTHWREPHQPTERALRLLDVLGRLAADLMERNQAEAALRESWQQSQFLASIVESSDDAIVSKDLNGIITSWNKGAERVFRYPAEEVIGKLITILIPPDRQGEEPSILDRIRRGVRIDHYETIRQRNDGSLIDISLTVSPIKDAHGKIVGASKIARDITDRKRAEERIATLAREAEHRTKNVLATVQATVNLSQSDTPEGLKEAIEGRIQALANVHTLFMQSRWTGAELCNLAMQELAPYLHGAHARAAIDGPQLWLDPNTAQMLAITLHELATNAAKYGALSVAEGNVAVTWSRAADGRLVLRWTEKGGSPVKPPTRRGFGIRVVEHMIGGQLKGDLRLD